MLKRLIGVLTVKNGWCVQSFGYARYMPLGRPEIMAENLDQWLLDEILVLAIDRSSREVGPDLSTLDRIAARRILTPLTYGGGIRNAEDAKAVVQHGADRVVVDALARKAEISGDVTELERIRDSVGVQAMVCAVPLISGPEGDIQLYDYRISDARSLDLDLFLNRRGLFSEVIAIDKEQEGSMRGFRERMIAPFLQPRIQTIAFGGITSRAQAEALFKYDCVSAVAVGNSLNYTELANRALIRPGSIDRTRITDFGERTRGVREW